MNEPIFMSDGEVDPISRLHIPRVYPPRPVDTGDWVAMPGVEMIVLTVGTGITILMGWGAFELVRWVWRLFT